MEKIKLSVIGSCACRDFFEYGNDQYEFHTDIRFCSPISLLAEPLDGIKVDFSDMTRKAMDVNGNWYKKTIINDINKTALSSLKENHGDYLILDFAESRMRVADVSFPNVEGKLKISYSGAFRKQYTANLSRNVFKDAKFDITEPCFFDNDYWTKVIEEFSSKLLEIFKEENIILIENMPAHYYVDSSDSLRVYSSKFHQNEILTCEVLLPKLYEMFKEVCPRAKVIKIPAYAIGVYNHKWGTHPFHFNKNYYLYLLESVNSLIVDDKKDNNTEFIKYTELFKKEFEEARSNSIKFFNSSTSEKIDYLEVIENSEELSKLGKRKKAELLFVLQKKGLISNIKKLKN